MIHERQPFTTPDLSVISNSSLVESMTQRGYYHIPSGAGMYVRVLYTPSPTSSRYENFGIITSTFAKPVFPMDVTQVDGQTVLFGTPVNDKNLPDFGNMRRYLALLFKKFSTGINLDEYNEYNKIRFGMDIDESNIQKENRRLAQAFLGGNNQTVLARRGLEIASVERLEFGIGVTAPISLPNLR